MSLFIYSDAGHSRDPLELFFPAPNTAEGRVEIPADVSPALSTADGAKDVRTAAMSVLLGKQSCTKIHYTKELKSVKY